MILAASLSRKFGIMMLVVTHGLNIMFPKYLDGQHMYKLTRRLKRNSSKGSNKRYLKFCKECAELSAYLDLVGAAHAAALNWGTIAIGRRNAVAFEEGM